MFISKKKVIAGFDIGSNSIKVVQLKEQKGSYQLVHAAMVDLPSEAIVDNTLMDNASIVEAIQQLRSGTKADEAVSSISGNSVIIRKILVQTMTSEELEEQIQWEAEQYIPFDINDVNIDFQILDLDEHDSSRMNVLLVASKKDIVQDYVTVFSEAGMKLSVMDVDAFAVQSAFELNYDLFPEEVVALANIGANIINLNIIRNGISLFTRDVQQGGSLFTDEIQKLFNVGSDEAERIKISGQAPDADKLKATMTRLNENMALEMRRSLDFYNSTASEGRISKVFLSGGGAKTRGLLEAVSERLGVPVEILNPFRKIKYNPSSFEEGFIESVAPLMGVAVGLATRRVGDK